MFIERCLEPARKELDESSPYSFTYEAAKLNLVDVMAKRL